MAHREAKFLNGPTFTREEKLRVRTLYLVRGWTAGEIAKELGKEPRQITSLANHRGWAKRRREIEEKAARVAENAAIIDAKEFVEAVAIRGEEMAMKGFDVASARADEGDALGFSAAMSGTKTAVALTRQALGIDATQSAGQGVTLNMVFGAPVEAVSEPKPVEKVAPEAIEPGDSGDDLEFA